MNTASSTTTKTPKPRSIEPEQVQIKPVGTTNTLPTTEDMFLSPRVMDAGTFAKYAEMLKGIIAQASAQGRTLEDFSADAEEMIRRATESGTTLDKRLQAGVRLMKLIDERVDRTETALDQIQESLPSAETIQRRLEEHANSAIDGATARLEDIAKRAEERARAAHEHTERAAARLEALNAQIEQRAEQLETLTRECTQLAQHRTDELTRRAETTAQTLDARVDDALTRAQTRLDSITTQGDALREAATTQIDQLRTIIEPVRQGAERAVTALGMDPKNPRLEDSVLGRIESLVDRGETHIATTERLFRQIDELRNQAEGVKADFGAWLLDAADKVDTLEARRDSLEGPIATAASNLESFTPELETRIEQAVRTIEHLSTQSKALRESIHVATALADKAKSDLTNQSSQMQALLDGALHKLTNRVEEAGTWLGALITQAQQITDHARPESAQPENGQAGTSPDRARPDRTPTNPANTEAIDTLSDRSDALLRNLDAIQSSLESLRTDGDKAPIAFTIQAPRLTHDTAPMNGPISEPIKEPKPESRAASIPQRLHIDSLSFDGASVVHEHTPSTSSTDHDSEQQAAD